MLQVPKRSTCRRGQLALGTPKVDLTDSRALRSGSQRRRRPAHPRRVPGIQGTAPGAASSTGTAMVSRMRCVERCKSSRLMASGRMPSTWRTGNRCAEKGGNVPFGHRGRARRRYASLESSVLSAPGDFGPRGDDSRMRKRSSRGRPRRGEDEGDVGVGACVSASAVPLPLKHSMAARCSAGRLLAWSVSNNEVVS